MEVAQGWSASTTAINAVSGTTTGNYPSATGVDTGAATAALVHVVSATTSVATVLIQGSVDGTFWRTLATVTNPSSDGEMWAGPAPRHLRIRISAHTSDPISAFYCFRQMQADPIGQGWKKLDIYQGFTTAAGTGTITVATGKTATVSNTLTLAAGADSQTFTFPSTSATIARTDAANTFTGTQTFGTIAATTVGATTLVGAQQDTIAAKATDGAIGSAPGTIVITKGSALGSSTLATPTITTHDGYVLRIVAGTAFAHVVSCASGVVNGGSLTTITFTSAAIGDSVTLVAFQGKWYTIGSRGTITIS